mgnify:CR=1 FL=1
MNFLYYFWCMKFLKIPIYFSTDENGVKSFDTESMHRDFETEIKKLDDQSFQQVEKFLNKRSG